MKILLGSNGRFLIEEGYKMLDVPADELRVGYVTTAAKGVDDLTYLNIHKQDMLKEGLKFEEIDIENKTRGELQEFFKDKNVIHMEGGNTFYLLEAVKKSGFDKVIKELLEKGVMYVGTSAGAHILGPNIGFASSWVSKNATEEQVKGLNLVPFCVKAHYTDDKKEDYKEKMKNFEYPIRFLRDGQGFLCEDGTCQLVGMGQEVKL